MVFILNRRGQTSREETEERVEKPAVSGFVFKTFHGARKQKELFCFIVLFCFYNDSSFSVERSLPGTALPVDTGSEQGAPRGLAALRSTPAPCTSLTPNLPRRWEGTETPGTADVPV